MTTTSFIINQQHQQEEEEENRNHKSVRALIRIRPLLHLEPPCNTLIINQSNVKELTYTYNTKSILYKFDHCFGPNATQQDIFSTVLPLIDQTLNGISATVFAYGITGSGKTYTMEGTQDQPGIVHNATQFLYNRINQLNRYTELYLSMFEIYNDKICDLLIKPPPKCVQNTKYIHRIRTQLVSNTCKEYRQVQFHLLPNYEQFIIEYRNGNKKRSVSATNHNSKSSRSHLIVQFVIAWENTDSITFAKLNLVDLAGSENNKHSGNVGARMKESQAINASLFALDQVVTALNNRSAHIPYKNSKLTTILKDSLGGTSQAMMVTNISPNLLNARETYNTLNFATKTSSIVNMPITNTVDPPRMCPAPKRSLSNDSGSSRKKRTCLITTTKTDRPPDLSLVGLEYQFKSWANQVFDARIQQMPWLDLQAHVPQQSVLGDSVVQPVCKRKRVCVITDDSCTDDDSTKASSISVPVIGLGHAEKVQSTRNVSMISDEDSTVNSRICNILPKLKNTTKSTCQPDHKLCTPRTQLLERARKLIQSSGMDDLLATSTANRTSKQERPSPPKLTSSQADPSPSDPLDLVQIRTRSTSTCPPMTPQSKQVLLDLVNSTDPSRIASLAVGKGRAKVIAEHVQLHGPIHTPRQLLDVYGVAKKTVHAMRTRASNLAHSHTDSS